MFRRRHMAGRRFPYAKKAAAGGLGSINLSAGTFTRSSTAMWWDGSNVTEYAVDVLREPVTNWLALEGSRVNAALEWADLPNWTTIANGMTVTGDDDTDPSGSTEADLLESSQVASYVRQTIALTDNVPMSAQIFLKGVLGGEDFITFTRDKASNNASATHTLTTSWGRYGHKDPDSATGAGGEFRVQNTGGDTDDDCHAWGLTLEENEFFTSPIENTSTIATATRSADSLTLTNAPAFLQTGKWQTKVRPSCSDADFVSEGTNMTLIDFQTTGEFLAMIVDAGAVKVRLSDGVTTTTTGAITFSADQELTITCDMASGNITIAGATTGDGTTAGAGAITFPASTNYRIGADYGGTAPFFGLITKTIDEVA